jgi:hypothetical protein
VSIPCSSEILRMLTIVFMVGLSMDGLLIFGVVDLFVGVFFEWICEKSMLFACLQLVSMHVPIRWILRTFCFDRGKQYPDYVHTTRSTRSTVLVVSCTYSTLYCTSTSTVSPPTIGENTPDTKGSTCRRMNSSFELTTVCTYSSTRTEFNDRLCKY